MTKQVKLDREMQLNTILITLMVKEPTMKIFLVTSRGDSKDNKIWEGSKTSLMISLEEEDFNKEEVEGVSLSTITHLSP